MYVNGRVRHIRLALVILTLTGWACGGTATSELTVVNTLQSSEVIRVDLGGDLRVLNVGDIALYRSVSQGEHVLLVESTTCVGTTLDTLNVDGHVTVRYLATRNLTSGECIISSTVTPTTKALPLSNRLKSASGST